MLETNRLYYIDLDKTGCTHVTNILYKILQDEISFIKHAAVTSDKHLALIQNKKSFVTIRNPWDWYVSLWRFGCTTKQRGGIFDLVKQLAMENELYSPNNFNNIEIFQKWFYWINDTHLFQTNWPGTEFTLLCDQLGYYSFRYLFLKYPQLYESLQLLSTVIIDIETFDQHFNYLDVHVRTHRLEEDLILFLQQHCQNFIAEDYQSVIWESKKAPANISEDWQKRLPYTVFYTDEMRDIVFKKDRLIIDYGKFTFSETEDLSQKD